eukprot:TRINITY_DN32876_c0_g1_i1.p1 TRINITY_DN32876_c0_g1~~TRINITY_DN32876_c0_g1_i1.p1  ORF type:complete len:234 (+),score=26.96 TRINITY_DN32876_c0_g1_i1:153-854(+)
MAAHDMQHGRHYKTGFGGFRDTTSKDDKATKACHNMMHGARSGTKAQSSFEEGVIKELTWATTWRKNSRLADNEQSAMITQIPKSPHGTNGSNLLRLAGDVSTQGSSSSLRPLSNGSLKSNASSPAFHDKPLSDSGLRNRGSDCSSNRSAPGTIPGVQVPGAMASCHFGPHPARWLEWNQGAELGSTVVKSDDMDAKPIPWYEGGFRDLEIRPLAITALRGSAAGKCSKNDAH